MKNKTKYSNEQMQEVLYDMLTHFKELHNKQNKALVGSGDHKYTSPFEFVQVQEIKDYALEKEGWGKF